MILLVKYMNNESIWKDSVDIKDYPKLDKDIEDLLGE